MRLPALHRSAALPAALMRVCGATPSIPKARCCVPTRLAGAVPMPGSGCEGHRLAKQGWGRGARAARLSRRAALAPQQAGIPPRRSCCPAHAAAQSRFLRRQVHGVKLLAGPGSYALLWNSDQGGRRRRQWRSLCEHPAAGAAACRPTPPLQGRSSACGLPICLGGLPWQGQPIG